MRSKNAKWANWLPILVVALILLIDYYIFVVLLCLQKCIIQGNAVASGGELLLVQVLPL